MRATAARPRAAPGPARDRQEPPLRRRDGARGELRGGADGRLPLVRRGHHVLAGRRDPQRGCRDPPRRRAGRRVGQAGRAARAPADGRSRRAADDRRLAREPDRQAADAAGNVRRRRDLAGRAPLGCPAPPAAARGRATTRRRVRGPALGRADAARPDRPRPRGRGRRADPPTRYGKTRAQGAAARAARRVGTPPRAPPGATGGRRWRGLRP